MLREYAATMSEKDLQCKGTETADITAGLQIDEVKHQRC